MSCKNNISCSSYLFSRLGGDLNMKDTIVTHDILHIKSDRKYQVYMEQ